MADLSLITPIEYLKGVGPQKADVLKKELQIFTIGDLLQDYPFRYIDRTKFHKIRELHPDMVWSTGFGKIDESSRNWREAWKTFGSSVQG
jgi:ATP-dependent DNA helicase RecG